MRKGPLAAMAALLVLSLALLIGAHLAVNSRRDQVDWDVTVLEGDLSAAQGVTAAIRLQDREGNLFWDTALTIGPEGYEADTDFAFLQEPPEDVSEPVQGWSVDTFTAYSTLSLLEVTGAADVEARVLQGEQSDFPWLAIRDVFSRTPMGETRTEIVDLADYYEEFPLMVTEYQSSVSGRIVSDHPRTLAPTLGPMPENTMVEITVNRNRTVTVSAIAESETLWPQIQFLPWGKGGLVYADMVNQTGDRAPFSSDIPLGQGICYLSTEGDGELTFRVPLDLSGEEFLDMELDSEGQLLVWTCEEDTLFLTVADPDTGAVRQRLELLETEDPDIWRTHQGENCLLVVPFDDEGRFCLLERQEGTYTLVLRDRLLSESVEDPCYPVEFQLFLCGTSVLWDGERMIWTLGEGAPEPEYGGLSKPIPLAVYDRTGRQCLAVLDCGLGRERAKWTDYYRFRDEDPVVLAWTNTERPGANQA